MKKSYATLLALFFHFYVINQQIHYIAASNDKQEDLLCEPRSIAPTISIPGETIITAIFDGHTGENCTIPLTTGLQQIAATVWAVSTANSLNLIPRVKIGLEVFDTCSDDRETQRVAVSAIAETECSDRYTLGLLSSERVARLMRPMYGALGMNMLEAGVLPEVNSELRLAQTAAAFLRAINRTHVAIFANSAAALRSFTSAAHNDICVTWQGMLPPENEDQDLALDKLPLNGYVLIISPWTTIKSVISKSVNASEQHWIIAPTDVSWQGIADDEESRMLPKDTLFLVSSEGHAPRLQEALQNETWLSEPTALGQLELPEPLLRQAARAVQLAAARLQNAIKTDCGTDEEGLCPELKPLTQHASTEESESTSSDTFHIPQHEPSANAEPVMRLGRVSNDKLEVLASLQQFNQAIQLYLNDNTSAVTFCSTCVCLNNVHPASSVWHFVHWRHEVWVATVTSIAAVGILCAIAIAIFITVRICKGDVLEGNPAYSFVLLGAVMAAYIAVLPYCVIGPRLVCVLRELGTALGHALLLGTMLARAIMLASTDDQGFMSHVNGYLQAALWFFIIGVQVALSTQQWLLRSSTDVSETDTSCMLETTTFLLLLSYTMLLLFLLLLVCPLVVRSKRNYREGFCFSVATVLYTLTWLLWLISYVLVPGAWQAPIAAAGLVAGASAVLIAVFIPRTYLMVSSVARARLASAIPCTAAGMHSNSVLDINYRSHQALYDSVNAMGSCNATPAQLIDQGLRRSPALNRHTGTGLANPNYYSEHPLPCSGSAASTVVAFGRGHAHMAGGSASREQLSPSPENTYERYDSPPSPHKVTRF